MAGSYTFPYKPNKGAPQFQVGTTFCAVDIIFNNAYLAFGVLEIVGAPTATQPATAQWMGLNANTNGAPVWQFPTNGNPIGDSGDVFDKVAGKDFAGSALDLINQLGTKLITDFKEQMNATLIARFPLGGFAPPVPSGPPFADEPTAITWLLTQPATLKVANNAQGVAQIQ